MRETNQQEAAPGEQQAAQYSAGGCTAWQVGTKAPAYLGGKHAFALPASRVLPHLQPQALGQLQQGRGTERKVQAQRKERGGGGAAAASGGGGWRKRRLMCAALRDAISSRALHANNPKRRSPSHAPSHCGALAVRLAGGAAAAALAHPGLS